MPLKTDSSEIRLATRPNSCGFLKGCRLSADGYHRTAALEAGLNGGWLMRQNVTSQCPRRIVVRMHVLWKHVVWKHVVWKHGIPQQPRCPPIER